ncbi:MAG: hypothetical protein AB7F78_05535 [Hyphomicrobiaceae bacterium]
MLGSSRLVHYVRLLGMVYAASLIVHLVVGAAGVAIMRTRHGRGWSGQRRVGRAFLFTFPLTIMLFFVLSAAFVGMANSDFRGQSIPWLAVLVQGPVFALTKFPFRSLVTVGIGAAFALWIEAGVGTNGPLARDSDPRLG